MSRAVRVIWDETLTSYNFGPGHPLAPIRVDLTMRLARALGLLDRPNVTVGGAEVAGDDLLGLVHEPGYIAAVRAASEGGGPNPRRGLGSDDNPVFPGMHEASAH